MVSPTAATFAVKMAGATAAEDTQITVRFSTKLPDAYRVPGDPVVSVTAAHAHVMCRHIARHRCNIVAGQHACCLRVHADSLLRNGAYVAVQAVPGKLSRYGLSQVINGLLDLGKQRSPTRQYAASAAADASVAKTRPNLSCLPHVLSVQRREECLHAEVPRPFDFLVAGELVRQPLQQLATALGISAVCCLLPSCFLQPMHLSRRNNQLCH
jgi:hypothetical protein